MIQPLLLDNILNLFENNKPIVKSGDFLFELLKNIDDKSFIKEIITASNLPENEKNKLFEKFGIKTLKIEIKNSKIKIPDDKQHLGKNKKLNSFFIKSPVKEPLKTEIKIPKKSDNSENITDNEKNKKLSFLEKLISDDSKLEEEIKHLPLNQQTDIVKEIKNILVSKAKSQSNIQMLVNTKEFKKVSNIKDLIVLSKKFGLNLTKIVIKSEIKSDIKTTKSIETEVLQNVSEFTQKKLKKTVSSDKIQRVVKKPETKVQNVTQKEVKTDLTKLLSQSVKNINTTDEITVSDNKIKPLKKEHQSGEAFILNGDIKTEFKQKIIEAKQSIKHFVSSLKEAVENYKPPLTKLSLELHPKELGKVEVVIRHQGENLNIQINTNNTSTINFLTSQQNELKNSLVNMGFTNINMNFNSNDQNRKHNKQNPFQNISDISNEDDELVMDFTYKYA